MEQESLSSGHLTASPVERAHQEHEVVQLGGVHAVRGDEPDAARLGAAMFADLTEDERDELLEYLAWYRARKRSKRRNGGSPSDEG